MLRKIRKKVLRLPKHGPALALCRISVLMQGMLSLGPPAGQAASDSELARHHLISLLGRKMRNNVIQIAEVPEEWQPISLYISSSSLDERLHTCCRPHPPPIGQFGGHNMRQKVDQTTPKSC